MNEKEETIDLRVLLKVFTERIIPIFIVSLIAAGIGFSLAKFIIPKRYTSEALMYVENSASKQEDSAININDINAAQKLVNTCQILFTSNYVFDELNTYFGGVYTNSQLKKMIKIESVNSTEVLKISVESKSPQESYDVANELLRLSVAEFQRIIKGGSIETVSSPTLPETHTYPSAVQFTIIAALIGAAATYFVFLILEIIDTKVKPADDLAQMYDLPVFAEILDFETSNRSEYKYYKYSSYENYDPKVMREERIYSREYEDDLDASEKVKASQEEKSQKDNHEEEKVNNRHGQKKRQTADK